MRWRAARRWPAGCTLPAPSTSLIILCRQAGRKHGGSTPIKRLRAYTTAHSCPAGGARVEIQAPPEVVVDLVERGDPRLGTIYIPNDRVAAQAWDSFEQARITLGATWRRVGRAGGGERLRHRQRGRRVQPSCPGHRRQRPSHRRAAASTARPSVPATPRSSSGTAPSLILVSVQDWDDDAGPSRAPACPDRTRRELSPGAGEHRRRRGPNLILGRLRSYRAGRRSC